jgi:hypothetical protein
MPKSNALVFFLIYNLDMFMAQKQIASVVSVNPFRVPLTEIAVECHFISGFMMRFCGMTGDGP